MDAQEYKKLISKHKPKENKIYNAFISFLVGGSLGLVGQIVFWILNNCLNITEDNCFKIICLALIGFSSLFTCLAFFDDWILFGKSGFIILTSGFAHSVASAMMEYKKDGLITGVGSNFLKLAGSVILYGIVSAFIFCVIGAFIYGI